MVADRTFSGDRDQNACRRLPDMEARHVVPDIKCHAGNSTVLPKFLNSSMLTCRRHLSRGVHEVFGHAQGFKCRDPR